MGVHHPGEPVCVLPGDSTAGQIIGSAGLIQARAAHREALLAAVRYAAAQAAARAIGREAAITGQRVRALRHRRIPQLSGLLAQVELDLEEQERAEAVRRRWSRHPVEVNHDR
jgi:V/A-type H+-transporting ATPase subunit D